MKNIKLIRLLNGDTILAEVLEPANDLVDGIKIRRPVRVVVMPQKHSDKPSVGFAPFMDFTEDEEMILTLNHITTMATPIDEFVKEYKKIFATILTPDTGIILPN